MIMVMGMKSIPESKKMLGDDPLFGEIGADDMRDLMALASVKKYPANKAVIRQGEPGGEMYFILDGSVYIRLCIAEKEELTVGELYSGETFGEIALFDEQPRTATVVTAEPCEFLVLTRGVFNDYLMAKPHVAIQLLKVMSRRLRAADNFLKEAMHTNVTAKLAETLKNIARAYGKNTPEGLKIENEFADTELGEYAGIPPDVVSAQLRHWENAGVIKMSHGCLTLVKPEELSKEG
jgi:CRP-like cAMP-binding protein